MNIFYKIKSCILNNVLKSLDQRAKCEHWNSLTKDFLSKLSSPDIYIAGFNPIGIDRSRLQTSIVPKNYGISFEPEEKDIQSKSLDDQRPDDTLNSKTLGLTSFEHIKDRLDLVTSYRFQFSEVDKISRLKMKNDYDNMNVDEKEVFLETFTKKVNPKFSNSFRVCLSVITHDDKIVLFKNTSKTNSSNISLDCTISKEMNVNKENPETEPNPFKVAEIELEKLLGVPFLETETDKIKFTTLMLASDVYEWGILGYIDLRSDTNKKFTSHYIRKLWANSIENKKIDSHEMIFVEFSPKKTLNFIRKNIGQINKHSLVCFIHTLMAEFPNNKIVI